MHRPPGRRGACSDLARLVLSAEAVGIARECTEMAAAYAKEREQFGRPIAMFQAVKHHCANMLVSTELATCLVWDAARASDEERSLAPPRWRPRSLSRRPTSAPT